MADDKNLERRLGEVLNAHQNIEDALRETAAGRVDVARLRRDVGLANDRIGEALKALRPKG